jgi:hypothetical protein
MAKIDPTFKRNAAAEARALAIAAMNAAPGQTAQQYIESRGGVNASGYYGDSYGINSSDGVSLTDEEYATTVGKGGEFRNALLAKKIFEKTGKLPSWWGTQTPGYSPTIGGSVGGAVAAPTPITPNTAVTVKTLPPPPIKTAPIDTVLFDDNSMSIEIMTDLIFEDIGGHELINIARNDIINGQQVSYTPIKNLGLIQQMYNPNNILRLQATSERYFNNFSIKFEEKVPLVGNGPNGSNVYIEQATGDLIIEGVNINKDELFEVEISLNGTIYIANFGETTS